MGKMIKIDTLTYINLNFNFLHLPNKSNLNLILLQVVILILHSVCMSEKHFRIVEVSRVLGHNLRPLYYFFLGWPKFSLSSRTNINKQLKRLSWNDSSNSRQIITNFKEFLPYIFCLSTKISKAFSKIENKVFFSQNVSSFEYFGPFLD